MSDSSPNLYSANVTSTAWDEDVEEALEATRLARGDTTIDMKALLPEADEIEEVISKAKAKVPQLDPQGTDNLTDLIQAARTKKPAPLKPPSKSNIKQSVPVIQKKVFGKKDPTLATSHKPHIPAASTLDETASTPDAVTEANDYQESFASQQEAAEIRHHIESLDNRMLNMETLIESLLQERKGLPAHIDRYREDMNKQLTIIADRLHTALEKNISPNVVEQSKDDVMVLSAESENVLTQLKTDLSVDPSVSSATSLSAPISKLRKKIRVVE